MGDVREYLPERLRELPDDAWVVSGKSWSEADRTEGKNWFGVIGEAVVWAGFKDRRGGHASTTEYRALLMERHRRHRSAYAWCEPPAACEEVLPALLRSFEFSASR